MMQVSELSHKLGTSEGNCKSLEEELARLQTQHVHLSRAKSEREVDANESRAKLHAAEEKVCHFVPSDTLAAFTGCAFTPNLQSSKIALCLIC